MKKIYALLGAFLLMFCFVLSGCGGVGSMPKSDAIIVGNGGFVAQKGEYIYFANAYTGYETLSSGVSNKEGKVVEYGLYRVKAKDIQSKEIEFDKDGYPKNVEKIVSKVVGFENSNFYIVGDYLYFSSPNIHKNSSNKNMYDLISIFRVRLDGSQLKELYTTESSTNGDFAIYNLNGENYLITVEGAKVYKQQLSKKGLSNKKLMCDDLASTILVDEIKFENDNRLYYTASRSKEDVEIGLAGNVLKYVDLITGEKEIVSNNVDETITLVNRSNGVIFYTKKSSTENANYWIKDFSNPDRKVVCLTELKNFYYMGLNSINEPMPMIYTFSDKLIMQSINSYEVTTFVDEKEVTPIFVAGEYVYYTTPSALFRKSYKEEKSTKICSLTDFENKFDFDGRYIYYFAKLENSDSETKYLHRVDTYAIEQGSSAIQEIFSKISNKDKTDKN